VSEQFSWARLRHLLWLDSLNGYRHLLLVSAVFAGLMIVHGILAANDTGPQRNIFIFWALLMLFGWGPVAASHAFRELNDKERNEAYLLLPASALEKTVARLVFISVGFAVYVVLFTNVVSWISAGINAVLFGREGLLFPFFYEDAWLILAIFLVHQSLYFVGAAWFRKAHFVKTALVLTFAPILLAIFASFVIRLFFPEIGEMASAAAADPNFNPDFHPGVDPPGLYQYVLQTLSPHLKILTFMLFVIVPIFCWAVAWMRVREAQVSHGV